VTDATTLLVDAPTGDAEVGARLDDRDFVDVSILVPTRNEVDNVAPLTEALAASMGATGYAWELVFLDDSDDTTAGVIAELRVDRPEVRMLHRPPGERPGGLAGAVVAGFGLARGRVLVVMDADLQHPPELARRLATAVLHRDCDIAVASRYVAGASAAGLSGPGRRFVSRVCAGLVHGFVPGTRGVRDPMSGFFAVARDAVEVAELHPHGFKVLMEVLARSRARRVIEVPFRMEPRAAAVSKAGTREGVRFVRHVARLVRPGRVAAASAAARVALAAPLVAILAVQSWLSLRLIRSTTAFIDEATYLSAGHYLLHSWSSGHSPDMHFPTYFSGAPAIYPVLGAMADAVGGLLGARLLSLAFMLTATILCYGTARRLFGRPAGWLAAGLFVTTQGTQYLGAFATYDAMSLMLIALAAWLVVRYADSAATSSMVYLAVPVLALANATKYASAAFDPVVVGLAFFAVWDAHGRRSALRVGATLVAGLVAVAAVLLAVAGPAYVSGILSTTVARPASTAAPFKVLHLSWAWVGAIASVAILAVGVALVSAWRRRTTWMVAGLLAVLTSAVFLAPLNQARIHTETSLSKHVTFGAFFGAVAAGYLVERALRWRAGALRRPWVAIPALAAVAVGLVPLGMAGAASARHLFEEWPNSTRVVSALRPLVRGPHQLVLMDDTEVARYYLQRELDVPHWVGTFYFAYTEPSSRTRLVGPPAYAAAVDAGAFSVIALDFGAQTKVDDAVAVAIRSSGRYAWVGDFTTRAIYGRSTYVVWRLKGGAS
jgi:hypothetical protein